MQQRPWASAYTLKTLYVCTACTTPGMHVCPYTGKHSEIHAHRPHTYTDIVKEKESFIISGDEIKLLFMQQVG